MSNTPNDPFYLFGRGGTKDSPFKVYNEPLSIFEGRVLLTEVPHNKNHVVVKDGSTVYGEVYDSGALTTDNVYFVDYDSGTVYFDNSHNGKQLTFSYTGEGYFNVPARRVYTQSDNGEPTQNLQDMIDNYNQLNGTDLYNLFDPQTGHKHSGASGDAPPINSEYINYDNKLGLITNVNDALDSHREDLQQRKINLRQPPYNANLNSHVSDILNQALTDLSSTGGTIFLPSGTFIVDKVININSSGITLEGVNGQTIFKIADNAGIELLQINNSISQLTIRNIIFDGNQINNGNGTNNAQLLCIKNTNRFLVENCQFINSTQDGLSVDNSSTNGVIRNCYVSNTGQDGIVIRNSCDWITIENCEVNTTGTISGVGDGIIIKGNYCTVNCNKLNNVTSAGIAINAEDGVSGRGFYNKVLNNSFYNCVVGLGIGTVNSTLISNGNWISDLIIEGNIFENTTNKVISIMNVNNIVISGNIINQNTNQQAVFITSCNRITMTSNHIENSFGEGINLTSVNYATLSGNNLLNTLQQAGTTSIGALTISGCSNVIVRSMNIFLSKGKGIQVDTSTDCSIDSIIDSSTTHGVYIGGSSIRCKFTGIVKNSGNNGVFVEASDIVITCEVQNASTSANGSYSAIVAQGSTNSRVLINGCKVTTTSNNKHSYGIYIDSITNSYIINNIIQNGTVGGVRSIAFGSGTQQLNNLTV